MDMDDLDPMPELPPLPEDARTLLEDLPTPEPSAAAPPLLVQTHSNTEHLLQTQQQVLGLLTGQQPDGAPPQEDPIDRLVSLLEESARSQAWLHSKMDALLRAQGLPIPPLPPAASPPPASGMH